MTNIKSLMARLKPCPFKTVANETLSATCEVAPLQNSCNPCSSASRLKPASLNSKAVVTRCQSASLPFGLRHDAQIRSRGLPAVGILLPGFFVGHRAGNDHVVALFPIHRRCDFVLRGELKRIEHAQNLVEVAASGHGIDEDQLDLFIGPHDKH